MSTLINPVFISIFLISVFSIYSDIRFRKIYNSITLPSLILGLLYSFIYFGFSGLFISLMSIILAFFLFGWMYLSRQIGAGDVKLLMAFAVWGGIPFTFHTAILSIFIGAFMGLIILVKEKKLTDFYRKIKIFIYGLIYKEMSTGFPEIDKKLTFPFGVAISLAALIEYLFQPIEILRGAV